MTLSTNQIENQAEAHRAHISELLEELRARVTPGEVLDQFIGWEEGQDIARTFGRQVKNNPLPLALIGTGVAWLMFSDGAQRRNGGAYYATSRQSLDTGDVVSGARSMARSAADAASDAAGYMSSTAASVGDSVRESGAQVSGAAQSAYQSARETASTVATDAKSAYAQAKDGISTATDRVTSTASSVWQKTAGLTQTCTDSVRDTGTSLGRMAQEQPLLTAGLGFALGMALGALFPATDAENSLLGEQSDAVKPKAGELADQGYEKAKAVAQRSYEAASDAAKQEAQNQGLTSEDSTESRQSSSAATSEQHDLEEPYGSKNGGDYRSGPYPHH